MADNKEVLLCKQYVNKAKNAEDRGLEFTLTFAEFKRLKSRKRCEYSRLPLNDKSLTLERIDSKLGYTKENTTVCHNIFNVIKGTIENPNNPVEFAHLARMLKYLKGK